MTHTAPPPVTPVHDDVVLLRRITLDDVSEAYCRWLNDPEVNQYLETRFHPQTRDSITAYVELQTRAIDAVLLAIVRRTDAGHVGNLRIGAIDWVHRTATIALFVGDRSAWGGGLGTRAIALASRVAFEQLGLVKLTARCYSTNTRSIRAFERAGWTHEGRQRSQFVCGDARVDGVWLGLAADAVHS